MQRSNNSHRRCKLQRPQESDLFGSLSNSHTVTAQRTLERIFEATAILVVIWLYHIQCHSSLSLPRVSGLSKGNTMWTSTLIVNIDESNVLSKRSWRVIIGSLWDKIPTKTISPFHSVNGRLQASSVISLSSGLWGLCDQLSPAEAGGLQCITRCKPHKQQHFQVR